MKRLSYILAFTSSIFLLSCDNKNNESDVPLEVVVKTELPIKVKIEENFAEIAMTITAPTKNQTVMVTFDKSTVFRATFAGRECDGKSPIVSDFRGYKSITLSREGNAKTSSVNVSIEAGGVKWEETFTIYWIEKDAPEATLVSFYDSTAYNHFMPVSKRNLVRWEIYRNGEVVSQLEKFDITGRVVKGKGVLVVGNTVVWCDTVANFEQKSFHSNTGINGMYTGFEIGVHEVEYTITDKDGKSTKTLVEYKVDSTRFDPVLKTDAGTPLVLDGAFYFDAMPYKWLERISYYTRLEGFNDNVTLLGFDGKMYKVGENAPSYLYSQTNYDDLRDQGVFHVSLYTSDRYMPETSGFIVLGDNWGREYRFAVKVIGKFTLQAPRVSFEDLDEDIEEGGVPKKFKLHLSQSGANKLRYKYRLLSGGGRLLDKSGAAMSEGVFYDVNLDDSYSTAAELYYDCQGYTGGAKLEVITIGAEDLQTVKNQLIKVVATQPSVVIEVPELSINRMVDIKVNLSKKNYAGNKLKVTYAIFTDSDNLGGGTFDVSSGGLFGVGEHTFKYTAATCGRTKIRFTVTDEYGRRSEVFSTFTVNPIIVTVDLKLGNRPADGINPTYHTHTISPLQSQDITFTITDTGHSGNVDFSVEDLGYLLFNNNWNMNVAELYLDGVKIDGAPMAISKGQHTLTVKSIHQTLSAGGWIKCKVAHTTVSNVFAIRYSQVP